ncbi:MAG: response regulator transcription factor [Stagnimonas sp.]|nr:response regulator transcription factor [Stagnimonas sp.]
MNPLHAQPTRILVLEDHPDARQWFCAVAARAFPQALVHGVPNLAEARSELLASPPQLALVDLGLPDGSGLEFIETAVALKPAVRCLVTTVYDDEAHVFPALRAGARGYLLKDEPEAQMLEKILSITRDETPLSPSVATMILNHFVRGARDNLAELALLTEREQDILRAVTNGYTLAEVAARSGITRNTVHTHVKRIYSKLNIGSRSEAVLAATRMGLVDRNGS